MMFFRRKTMLIALPAFVGTVFLSIMLIGARGPSDGPSFNWERAAQDQRDHQPWRDVGSVKLPPPVQHHGSPASPEKSHLAGLPSGTPDHKASVVNQPETARPIEGLPKHSSADANARFATVEGAAQKAHRSGLYAVLLVLLANSRH